MPLIRMSTTLTSPMLTTRFKVWRRTEEVSSTGRSKVSPQDLGYRYGVVVPAGDNELQRLTDMQFAGKAISVTTKFRLRGPADGFQPDYVEWRGSKFVVRYVNDLSEYGEGWVKAVCSSDEALDEPAI